MTLWAYRLSQRAEIIPGTALRKNCFLWKHQTLTVLHQDKIRMRWNLSIQIVPIQQMFQTVLEGRKKWIETRNQKQPQIPWDKGYYFSPYQLSFISSEIGLSRRLQSYFSFALL